MATEAQVLANRANAQKSTGPRTPGVSLAYFEISSLAIVVEGSRACPRENKANWRTPVVQTNPIPRGWLGSSYGGVEGQSVQNEPNFPIADCGLGTDLRRDACPAASRLVPRPFQGRIVQTNPIRGPNRAKRTQFRAVGRLRPGPIASKQSQSAAGGYPTIPLFHHSSIPIPCLSCKTNPIPGGAGWDGAPGAWDAEQSCETNPICVASRGTGILPVKEDHGRDAHATEPPASVIPGGMETQGQSCETNPICVAPAVEIPRPATMPSFQDSNLRPEVQGQARQTNPICPER
jgi:hypothetical protein